jgi:hypothetical protein
MPVALIALRRAAGFAVLIAAAVVAARVSVPVAADHPIYVAALAAVVAGAVLAARFEATALVALAVSTCAYGTVAAYFPEVKAKYALDFLAAALWGAALWRVLFSERRAADGPLALGVILLGAFMLVTSVQGAASPSAVLALKSFHKQEWPLMLVLLGAFAPWTDETRRRAADGVVFVALAVGAYACLRYATDPSSKELSHALADPANRGYVRRGDIDVFGSFTLPKDLGAWTAMALPLCLAGALLRSGAVRVAAALACPLLVVANFGSNTRTALVALVVGVVLVLVVHPFLQSTRGPRLDLWFVAVALAVGTAVGGYVITQPDQGSRYSDLLHPSTSQSFNERQRRWESAWNEIRANPLGGGLGIAGNVAKAHGTVIADLRRGTVDSTYVKVALEQGVVTVLFIISLVALAAGLVRRALVAAEPALAAIGLGAAGALVAILVLMYSGVYAETSPAWFAWLVAALAIGLPARRAAAAA